jgi:hypothetical protein
LRQRLYLLTAVALAPALIILLYNEVVTRRERESEVHRTAMRVGELASLEIQRIIDGSEGVLRTLANAPSIRDFDAGLCAPFLADVKAQSPQFTSIAAVDAEGVVRCRPDAPATPPEAGWTGRRSCRCVTTRAGSVPSSRTGWSGAGPCGAWRCSRVRAPACGRRWT